MNFSVRWHECNLQVSRNFATTPDSKNLTLDTLVEYTRTVCEVSIPQGTEIYFIRRFTANGKPNI